MLRHLFLYAAAQNPLKKQLLRKISKKTTNNLKTSKKNRTFAVPKYYPKLVTSSFTTESDS